ncbi:MAG TPA: DMT family transporter [Chthonomonadaceae bacterium]|nr:DMT family transporter [Chthonomonadaceae bacterium]
MPYLAVGLVLFSCLLHASWNLLVKRAHDKLAFTALYLASATVFYLPLFLTLFPHAHITPQGWLCILGTGIVYFGYFTGVAAAYRHGELSVAYPVMRGAGPAFAFFGGILLFSERPSMPGTLGVALALLSVCALGWRGRAPGERFAAPHARRFSPATLAALFVGLMYSLYSLIDKIGVGRLHINPPIYIYLTYTTSALFVLLWVLWRQGGATLREEWRVNGRACMTVGILNLFTYLLVLYAMAMPGTPVSYIVPLRTTSVLFGVLLGVRVLGEGRLAAKLSAALLMMAGIALMAWKG